MATIIVDDKEYEITEGNNLLHACLSLGLNLPYFCWHPCMGSVGACRQCAVKQYQDENDTRGRLVMACMTPAADRTRISIDDPQAKDFRAGIIELLMTNHPHDCPVCEEGGECHLQDMTEMTGHTFRRYDQTKRTHRNQYLGPFINHEMNRCITCYRCVRYYQDYAGGSDLQAMAARNNVYFGRHCEGTLESPFSGNLVEVCPTGVFTDKTFSAHYTRKWDLQCAPSICQHCALGCNTSPGERYGSLRRIVNRYHSEINGYFLCDRGRFGYGFVNSDQRLRQIWCRDKKDPGEDQVRPGRRLLAVDALATLLKNPGTVAIGSPRASMENNFALWNAVGQENYSPGLHPKEEQLLRTIATIYCRPGIAIPTLREIESSDAVVVLGEDILNTAPVLALRVRQAVRRRAQTLATDAGIPVWQDAAVQELAQQEKNPLALITPAATELDNIATLTCRRAPADIARIGFAIAHSLHTDAPAVTDLSEEDAALVKQIGGLLKNAKRPLVISGTSLLQESVIEAAANIAQTLSRLHNAPCPLHYCLAECNTQGVMLLPSGQTLEQIIEHMERGEVKRAIVMENDLYRRFDRERLDRALDKVDELIVLDHLWTETAAKADWLLPAASFAEEEGTLINSEGRAQRFFAVYPPGGDIQPSWQWLSEALDQRWRRIDDVTHACSTCSPLLAAIVKAAPDATAREPGTKVPRMSHRYSGRTAMNAHINVSEPRQPVDDMSPLGFTMEGNPNNVPPALRPDTWAPGWNSNQSIYKFQGEVNGELIGGPSGVRLLNTGSVSSEKESDVQTNWFTQIPPVYKAEAHQFTPVPLYHIFGSEELSSLAAPIAERFPQPYLALHSRDAQRLELRSGDGVAFAAAGREFRLSVLVLEELPPGLAGLPIGLGGLSPAALEAPLKLQKAPDWKAPARADDDNVFARDKTGITL